VTSKCDKRLVLITVAEAAAVLALKSRGSIYRKIRSGELASVDGPTGPLIEREGLEAAWMNITRTRTDSPRPKGAPMARARKLQELGMRNAHVEHGFQLPDYNESRARSEYEKANLLELERKQKEKLLLPADQVERVWANTVATVKTKLLAVPTRLRQRIPHLSLEEVAIADELIRESLQELAEEGESDGE
jgi:hypothetical protein